MTKRTDPRKPSRRTRAVLGITPMELCVVVAVMACERAEDGYPCKRAIADLVPHSTDAVPSRLVGLGWLERAGMDGLLALYRATDWAYEALGEYKPFRADREVA